jgi:hypothetical protein
MCAVSGSGAGGEDHLDEAAHSVNRSPAAISAFLDRSEESPARAASEDEE